MTTIDGILGILASICLVLFIPATIYALYYVDINAGLIASIFAGAGLVFGAWRDWE